ncbi:hypothetical protein PIB30_074490, partial [Stylosanthes scabra]|nr:hypothetical protein [Stylosanthes scabra]
TRQASGESEEEAFRSIFGKEQPGRVRCYGRSVTQTDLQRHAEISALNRQHQEEVTTLKSELGDVKTQQQQQAEEIHGLRSMVKLLLQRSEPHLGPEEVEAMLQHAQNSPIDANSGHGSHYVRNVSTVSCYLVYYLLFFLTGKCMFLLTEIINFSLFNLVSFFALALNKRIVTSDIWPKKSH